MEAGRTLLALMVLSCPGPALADQTFQWKGEVDGVDEIQIRGGSVRVNHLEAQPIQRQDHRFSQPLPSRDTHLRLVKVAGRGNVHVVEEPNSWNDYTATVRIEDRQGGADFYEFELHWRSDSWNDWENSDWNHSNEWNDPFQQRREGLFRWMGRVDIGAEIEIRGKTHRVNDKGGSGTQEHQAKFSMPLPSSDAPVSLHKVDGRGRVELVQNPSRSNGYAAIVRITDDKGGADDYEFELSFRQ